MIGSIRMVSRLRLPRQLLRERSFRAMSSEPLPLIATEGPSEKIVKIVDQIAELNLLEVSELNKALKERLNISDAPMMMASGPAVASTSAEEEEEEESTAAIAVQTSFTLKLVSFDASKKIPLIKELKAQIEGMNLVQAKKFVESAPAVVKNDIGKEEAEKIKAALEAVGGACEVQ
ncbi:large ribosomal subunit protein bL12m [Lepeophtheirus salmonis]|uniref:large ribosomal subunit protein bL12m n=1 Tax=Lepeophtheirus salmonis TaxID=72036 RepID=UPI001AE872E3|nr:39S ribosomal protein L12, mitochondrial-like [Lepeophtheirus salmonis]